MHKLCVIMQICTKNGRFYAAFLHILSVIFIPPTNPFFYLGHSQYLVVNISRKHHILWSRMIIYIFSKAKTGKNDYLHLQNERISAMKREKMITTIRA